VWASLVHPSNRRLLVLRLINLLADKLHWARRGSLTGGFIISFTEISPIASNGASVGLGVNKIWM